MPFRRASSLIARLTLALFVLVQLVATAAPLLHPEQAQLVCGTDSNAHWGSDESNGPGHHPGPHEHGIHCPLCVPAGAPPSATPHIVPPHAQPEPRQPFVRIDAPARQAIQAPMPARGPPALS